MVATLERDEVRSGLPKRLPPSERDCEIYERLTVEKQSLRKVGAAAGLSATRVRQIRDAVADFLATEVPPTPSATPEQRIEYGRRVALAQLDHLQTVTMELFQLSAGAVYRRGATLGESYYEYTKLGDPKYLMAAMRLAVARAKVAMMGIRLSKAEDDAKNAEEPASAVSPPVVDCAPAVETGSKLPPAMAQVLDATPALQMTLENLAPRRESDLDDEQPTAHADEPGGIVATPPPTAAERLADIKARRKALERLKRKPR